MKFFKDQEYYKNVKVSAKEVRGMILSIDMQLEEMLRDANKTFDEYIEGVGIIKNFSNQLSSITTDIETDQTDEKHFIRAGGDLQRCALTSLDNLKKYVNVSNDRCKHYFDICERIRNLMCLRNTIVSKCNSKKIPIAKQEIPIQSIIDADDENVPF